MIRNSQMKRRRRKTQKIKLIISVAFLISMLLFLAIPIFIVAPAALPYTEITGTLNGANYLIRIPDPIETWNRNLVIYCHGYSHIEPQPPLTLARSDELIASGFACAMSSYGMGGYFIKTAMNNTYLLTQFVKNTFNATGKIFLFGISQGGGISLQLAEKYPNLYSGVLDLSGSKDLKISYRTRIDQLSAKDDAELIAKLQALGASIPPYPLTSLAQLQGFNILQRDDMENATGGTPDTVPEAYEEISATYHANISVPVITVHSMGDPINTYAQALAYKDAVAAAGKSNFYRLYPTNGTGHVDSTVTSQFVTRFNELVAWSYSLDAWTTIVDDRSLKAYPDLKETIWQKNASMPPNGQYDKIGLHRLVKAGIIPKGVVFLTNCPTWGTGEVRISNPANDTFTKYENYSQAIYWANRGFDVYAIDYRTHFVPKTLNASQMSFAANWTLDVWVSDIKEAAEKVKQVSNSSKFFISGECTGGFAALNYATKYWRTDLRGIILLDANSLTFGYPIVGRLNETNTFNLSAAINNMVATGNYSFDPYAGLRPLAAYALQNAGAPAINPITNQPLTPLINPLTNKTWANITEWFNYSIYYNFGASNTTTPYGAISNLFRGYGNITQDLYCFANSEFLPTRYVLEMVAMTDWVNNPYLSYDYNDHYNEIGVPVIAFESGLWSNRTGTLRFVNGLNTTDFTGIMLKDYGHLDIFVGTYSARDVSQPALQWMITRTLTPILPAVKVALTVVNGTSSYYNSTLTNMPLDYSIQNGNYVGWCVDKSTVMIRSVAHNVTLYSSLIINTLPSSINSFNWNAVNYILNHKQGSMQEIQDAIWFFVPDQVSPPINEANAIAMINAALANPNYMPGSGNILAIIAYSGSSSGVQNTIIEYRIP